jgi:hypothetical protein
MLCQFVFKSSSTKSSGRRISAEFEMKETQKVIELLRNFESRNVMFFEPDGSWPIVWERAKDVFVWDADGKKYLDLTAAFGVAAAGHANPNVVKAGQKQMARLLHAMGDVHPHALKARLAQKLSGLTFERWADESKVQSSKSRIDGAQTGSVTKTINSKSKTGKVIFCNSGFEAVEAALKTAALATKKNRHHRFFRRIPRTRLRHAQRHPSEIFSQPVSAATAGVRPFCGVSEKAFRPRRGRISNPSFFPARTHRRDFGRTRSGARRHQCSAP